MPITARWMLLVGALPLILSYDGEFLNEVHICTSEVMEHEYCNELKEMFISETHSITCQGLANRTRDVYECIQYTINKPWTVTMISSNEVITAERSNLTILASSLEETKLVLIVNPKKVRDLEDLPGKRGCFTQPLGAGELMFAQHLKRFCNEESCESDVLISSILEAACYQGCRNKLVKTSEKADCEKMCKLCKPTLDKPSKDIDSCINNISENHYAGTAVTMRCFLNRADFAIIEIDDDAFLPEGIKVMCPNGTLADTLELDDGCLIGHMAKHWFVTSSDQSNLHDMSDVLMEVLDGQGFQRIFEGPNSIVHSFYGWIVLTVLALVCVVIVIVVLYGLKRASRLNESFLHSAPYATMAKGVCKIFYRRNISPKITNSDLERGNSIEKPTMPPGDDCCEKRLLSDHDTNVRIGD